MKRYQTEDERELDPEDSRELFVRGGLATQVSMYDFGSSPLAGLFPSWAGGYRVARGFDDWLLKSEGLRRRGSNFELVSVRAR